MVAVVRAAEDLGYDSVWTPAHTAIPVQFNSRYPYSESGRPGWSAQTPWGDALLSLTFAAAITDRIRVGPSLIPLTITDPLTLAKQISTLDVYSEGRAELGIGAGWLVEEGRALGRATDHRLERLEETIEILRLAFSRETFSYEGAFFKIPEVGVNPRPVQSDRLPIWIGGHGQRAVELAARHGCGLMLWWADPDVVRDYRARLRNAGGTGPIAAAMRLAPTKGRWLEHGAEYAEAETDLLILTSYGRSARITEELEQFAAEVIPRLVDVGAASTGG
jgi:probable F420-dependent oxidoreductase